MSFSFLSIAAANLETHDKGSRDTDKSGSKDRRPHVAGAGFTRKAWFEWACSRPFSSRKPRSSFAINEKTAEWLY